MSTKKQTLKMMLPALIFSLILCGVGMAAMTEVGGLSLFITTSGTADSTPSDVTWDTPGTFTPDYVRCIAAHNTSSVLVVNEWYRGMTDDTAIHYNGTSGVITYHSNGSTECGFGVGTAGTITIGGGCLVASDDYECMAFRYSQ